MGDEKTIGIGITTYGRPDVLEKCLANMKAFLPPDAYVVVIDDASPEPVRVPEWVDHVVRHETNKGIAASKNACLVALEGCDHIFLFDDDTWPKVDEWWVPYVDSPEPHLMY